MQNHEINYEHTHYRGSEISLFNEQRESIKDYKCKRGYTHEIN